MWQSPLAGRVPELQQVAGRAAGGGDDRVAGPRRLVERADQLALAHRLAARRGASVRARSAPPAPRARGDARARVASRGASAAPTRRSRAARRAPPARRRRPAAAPSLRASRSSTLIATKRTSGCWKSDCEPVVKSVSRVPTAMHEVGLARERVRGRVALEPEAAEPEPDGLPTAPLPANVSTTGMPSASAKRRQRRPRPRSSGRRRRRRSAAARAARAARRRAATASGVRRRPLDAPDARLEERGPGSRRPRDCTSCGSAITTAPVSAGSVSTRIASGSAVSSCSGRVMRSKKRATGRKQSLTLDVARRSGARAAAAPGPGGASRRCRRGAAAPAGG